jgi:hypothetical protein
MSVGRELGRVVRNVLAKPAGYGAHAGGVMDLGERAKPKAALKQHSFGQKADQAVGQEAWQHADSAAKFDHLALRLD